MVSNVANAALTAEGQEPLIVDLSTMGGQAAVRRGIQRWPGRFRGISHRVRRRWLLQLELARKLARKIEDPAERAARCESIAKTYLLMARIEQHDDHEAARLAQDDKHLAVSWADQLAKASPDELVDAAIRLGLVDKLPPALRDRAKMRMEAPK